VRRDGLGFCLWNPRCFLYSKWWVGRGGWEMGRNRMPRMESAVLCCGGRRKQASNPRESRLASSALLGGIAANTSRARTYPPQKVKRHRRWVKGKDASRVGLNEPLVPLPLREAIGGRSRWWRRRVALAQPRLLNCLRRRMKEGGREVATGEG
jgi:hypothetical protein